MTTLNGTSGNDDLQVTPDTTVVNGNGGIDTIHFDQYATGAVTVNLANGTASVAGWTNGTITLNGITNIYGGTVGGTLTGGANTTYIYAPAGDTTIYTGDNSPSVYLGQGNDTVHGGAGNDEIYVIGTGSNTIDGGAGYNGVSYKLSAGYTYADLYAGAWHDGIQDHLTNIVNLAAGDHGSVLLGDWQSNILTGGAGNDYIDGRQGNDTLTGGGGHDTFVMESGVGNDIITDFNVATDIIDVSAFFSSFTQLKAAATTSGANTVIHLGANGSVTLDNVSVGALQASDFSFTAIAPPSGSSSGNHTAPAIASDVNGDGKGDILWQNGGVTSAWEMNDTAVTPAGLANEPGWQIQDTGNFEGGAYSGDLLWRNTTTGMVDIWTDTAGAFSGHDIGQVGLDWSIMGTADFNGDGKSDILFRNENNGDISIWLMNGNQVQSTFNPGQVGTEWHIVGAADYAGVGNAQILWRNANTGELDMWTINPSTGAAAGKAVATEGLEWQVVGSGDFNGDGKADILWHNKANGDVVIWEMNGTQVLASQTIANLGAQWKVADIVDTNGDGKADIVWRDSGSGNTVVWSMNGFNIDHQAGLGIVSTAWQTVNHHFDWL